MAFEIQTRIPTQKIGTSKGETYLIWRYSIIGLILTSCLGILFASEALSDLGEDEICHPDWARNAVIYEVNVRQYTSAGTFSAFEEHLPRLKEMGIGILWFMPIHPIGEERRKGTLGSYYSVRDYYAINPEFGSIDDFKRLVDKAHSMGLHVLIDWVANHCAWDNPLVDQHPDWFTRDSDGNLMPPVKDWSDVVDFDYSNRDLWKYMIDAMKYWVSEFDVDGFRCDVAGMVPLEFWIEARKELEKIKPIFMLAEWESPQAHTKAFDATYGWQLYDLMIKIANQSLPASSLGAYLQAQRQTYPRSAYRVYFTSNHDENSWHGTEYEILGRAAEALAVLVLTLDGIPLIYSGQEAGLDKRLAFFEKDEIFWREHRMAEIYRILVNLRKANMALWNDGDGGEVEWVHTTDDARVFAFVRKKDGHKVFVILNLSGTETSVDLVGKSFVGGYTQVLPFDPSVDLYFTGGERITLEPWGYRVFAEPLDVRLNNLKKADQDLRLLINTVRGCYGVGVQDGYESIRLKIEELDQAQLSDGMLICVERLACGDKMRKHVFKVSPRDDGTILALGCPDHCLPDSIELNSKQWSSFLKQTLANGCLEASIRRRGLGIFEAFDLRRYAKGISALGLQDSTFNSKITITRDKITGIPAWVMGLQALPVNQIDLERVDCQ